MHSSIIENKKANVDNMSALQNILKHVTVNANYLGTFSDG